MAARSFARRVERSTRETFSTAGEAHVKPNGVKPAPIITLEFGEIKESLLVGWLIGWLIGWFLPWVTCVRERPSGGWCRARHSVYNSCIFFLACDDACTVRTSAEHWVRALSAPRPQEADFRVGRTSKALALPLRYPLFHFHAAFQFIPLFPLTWAEFTFAVLGPHSLLTKRCVLPSRPLQGFSRPFPDESRGRITLWLPLLGYCRAWLQTHRHKRRLDDKLLKNTQHTHSQTPPPPPRTDTADILLCAYCTLYSKGTHIARLLLHDYGKKVCAAYRKDYHMTGRQRTTTLDKLKEHRCDKCNTETTINIQRARAVVYGVVRHPRSRFREWELWQNRPSGRPNWKQENKHSQGKLLQSSLQLLLRSDSFCPTCLEQCRSLCYSHNTSLQTTQMEKEHSTTKARRGEERRGEGRRGGGGGVRERERKEKLKTCGKRTHHRGVKKAEKAKLTHRCSRGAEAVLRDGTDLAAAEADRQERVLPEVSRSHSESFAGGPIRTGHLSNRLSKKNGVEKQSIKNYPTYRPIVLVPLLI